MSTSDAEHYDWLISARERNQRVLLRLYQVGDSRIEQVVCDEAGREVYASLVGAAFSMWRAAFLADAKRTWTDIVNEGWNLLETILQTNAVGFPEDRKRRSWMSGYYLNNAAHRLAAVVPALTKFAPEHDAATSIAALRDLQEQGLSLEKPRDAWEVLHKALDDMTKELEKKWGS